MPNETEEQYEVRLCAWVAHRSKGRQLGDRESDPDGSWERSVRIAFARSEAKRVSKAQRWVRTHPTDANDEKPTQPRRLDFSTKVLMQCGNEPLFVMSLAEYRDKHLGVDFTSMSPKMLQQQFGCRDIPVFVPLAPGESPEQYERRFFTWLERQHHLTPEQFEGRTVPRLRRKYRRQFAKLNGLGKTCFNPSVVNSVQPQLVVKSSAATSEKPYGAPAEKEIERTRKTEVDQCVREEKSCKRPLEGTTEMASVAVEGKRPRIDDNETLNHVDVLLPHSQTCLCHQCLGGDARALATGSSRSEKPLKWATRKSNDLRSPHLVGLTGADDVMIEDQSRSSQQESEHQLVAKYNGINERIMQHEMALESSVARFRSHPIRDATTMKRVQAENARLLELINEERVQRTTVMAELILTIYGDRLDELRELTQCKPNQDSSLANGDTRLHFLELSKTIAKKRELLGSHHNPNDELSLLHDQQRRAIESLIQSDAHLRRFLSKRLAQM